MPYELRRRGDDNDFAKCYGRVERSYRRITFEKQVARGDSQYEFMAPGHPLLEALNEVVLHELGDDGATQHAAFTDTVAGREGALWFVEGVVTDGLGEEAGRRIFCALQTPESEIETLNPAVLWDLNPAPDADMPEHLQDLVTHREAIEDHLMEEVLFPYREEIAERREQDARIKRRYGLRSLEHLIQESNEKLLDYQRRAAEGENMDLAIRNEERNRERLEQRRDDLKREIELERNVTVGEPQILGVAALVPAPEPETLEYDTPDGGGRPVAENGEDSYEAKKAIEMVGMRVATEYEEERDWRVEDVSEEEHGGFDLRSIRISEDGTIEDVRYIEVKARARSGAIRITSNEWKKARRYGEDY